MCLPKIEGGELGPFALIDGASTGRAGRGEPLQLEGEERKQDHADPEFGCGPRHQRKGDAYLLEAAPPLPRHDNATQHPDDVGDKERAKGEVERVGQHIAHHFAHRFLEEEGAGQTRPEKGCPSR